MTVNKSTHTFLNFKCTKLDMMTSKLKIAKAANQTQSVLDGSGSEMLNTTAPNPIKVANRNINPCTTITAILNINFTLSAPRY